MWPSIVIIAGVALAVAYPNLPDISDLSDYRPKLPLRVFSAEGVLIGEFGEERRNLTPIAEIPKVMKDAVLAIEDARFYSHGGVDYRGLLRAALANLGRAKSQGASTITMQVARNVYLSSEKTLTRKLYEVLLTFKLEHLLTKDQILEIYMNQIFLGNRAYGFAAAAEAYFGKPMKDLTIAEAAMLAGLPKAPSAFNPIVNPNRARARQLYIIERMQENGFITAEEAEAAKKQELQIRTSVDNTTHPCRVRRRNGPPARLCPIRRRGLHPRLERLHHHQGRAAGNRLQGAAQGHHGLRAQADLPRPRGVRRPARESQGSRGCDRRRIGRAPGQRRRDVRGSARSKSQEDRGGAPE